MNQKNPKNTIIKLKLCHLSTFFIGPTSLKNFYFSLVICNQHFLSSSHSTLLAWLGPLFHKSLPSLHSFHDATNELHLSMVHVGQMHRDSKLLTLFPHTHVDASCTSLVHVDTAVCRTACSSTPVQIQMGSNLYLLVGTATLTVYMNLSSFTVTGMLIHHVTPECQHPITHAFFTICTY